MTEGNETESQLPSMPELMVYPWLEVMSPDWRAEYEADLQKDIDENEIKYTELLTQYFPQLEGIDPERIVEFAKRIAIVRANEYNVGIQQGLEMGTGRS